MKKFLKRPLSILLSLVLVLGLFPGMSLTAYAAGVSIKAFGGQSVTISSDQTCTSFDVFDGSTLTVNQGVTLTLNISNGYAFNFFDHSTMQLHGTLAGSVASGATWMDNTYINVYLSDGAKYTVTGLTCMEGNNYLRYYGYDAATDGNGTVSVTSGSTAVTASSTGYKTTTYTFTATPSSGYHFMNWTKGAGGEVLGTDASISVTCEQNGQYQVYANFESDKTAQTITAEDVTATYGDTNAKIEATTTSGGGTLSYTVKSGDAVTVDASGNLTIVKAGTAVITVTAAETATYAQATKDVNVTVNTKDMTVSAEDVNVTVDEQPHGITVTVTEPASGATVKYGTEEGSYTLDESPTQTEVGEKTVYYQVTADNYTTYTGSAKVTISAKQTQNITAADVTATYGDTGKSIEASTSGDGTLSYAVKSGDAVTVNETTGALTIVKAGSAVISVTASETATYAQATKEVTVTINKANAVAATVTANNRTYDGTEKPLVTVDNSTLVGGTMYYALGENATTAPADNIYTTSIPTATNAGTYYVWYKVAGDEDHTDSEAECETVTIDKVDIKPTVSIKGWTYGKSANKPSVSGNIGNGEVTYLYKEKDASDDAYTEEAPVNAGDYTVKAVIAETDNYLGGEATADYTIEKATPVVTLDTKTLYYNGQWQQLVQSASLTIAGADGDIDISDEAKLWYSLEGGLNELDTLPVGKEIGTYSIYTRVEALTDNVEAIAYGEEPFATVKIAAVPTVTMTDYTYGDKDNFPTPEVEGNVGDGEVTYKYYPADGDKADAEVWDDSITELTLDAGDYKMFAEIAESDTAVAVTTEAVDFTVGVKTVDEPTITFTPEENTYNGDEIKPAVTVKDGDVEIDASEYTVTYTENINAGTATITVTDKEGGNYTVSGETTFVINKAELELTLTIEGWTFGEEANAPELTGNAGEGGVTYTYAVKGSDEFTADVPENAGDYTVKAVVAETDNYKSGEITADFTIAKAVIDPEVSIEDWTYGEEAKEPVLTGNTGEGEVTYTYATSDDYLAFLMNQKTADEAFTIAEAPTQAGTYVLRAEIAETDNYLGDSAYATFEIAKADIEPAVTIEGWTYGDDANEPEVSGNDGEGDVTYTYAVKGSDEFTADVPANAGDYTVKAVIAESANYNGGECTADFTIAKSDITPTVTIEGWTYGDDANEPEVIGNDGDGEVTITYAIKGSDEFTAEVPENAGEYTVKAVIAGNDNYHGAEATADFEIAKADITPTVTIESWTYGEDANEPVVTGNTGEGEVTITYAAKGSEEFTADVPANAGEYTVKAVIAATDNYNGAEVTADFTIAKDNIDPAVTIAGWTYGDDANEPEVTGNTGEGEVTYTYAIKGSDEFTADVPVNAGDYTVKAVIAATDNYNGAEATADFTITKADPTMAEDGDYNVVAQNLVFNNELQNLVTESVKEGSGLVVRFSFYPEGMNPQIAGNIPRAKDVGEYPIYYMVEGNDNYNDVPWTVLPLIAKIEKDTFEVSIDGWAYGEEANTPVASANFTDYKEFTYTYAVKGSDEFTAEVPEEVGEYTVKASITSDNAYYSTLTATADFTITKADITPTVTIEGWTYGEEANAPEVTGNTGEGAVTITYAVKDSDEFTEEVPTTAGEYTVKAVIAETDSYNGAEATADFTIAKADFAPTVTIEGWTYGEEANEPEVTGNSPEEGEVTITYAVKGSDEFTEEVPTDAGDYIVKAVIAATDNYNSEEATADFTVAKADITPAVTIEGWTYGEYDEAVNAPTVSGNPENGDVTYLYKVKDADDETYTDERPEDTGDYTVKAVVAETANYNGAEATADFTIVKAEIEPEIILDDWAYSDEPNSPAINEGGNPGNAEVTYTYAFKGSDAYSEIKPVLPGSYTVKAVIAETDNYLGTTVYKDFIIHKGTFEPTVTLESWLYGAEPNEPVLTGNVSEGAVKYTYAPEGSDAFSATVPSAAGEYVVKATIAATDLYDAVEVTGTFEIEQSYFTITWKNDDGSVIDTTTVAYGETPTHDDATKDATDQYTYTFAGWTPEVVAVTGDAEYTATYSSAVNEYTVTWVNGEDVLGTDTVAYGETPEYTGETPTKASTDEYDYTFVGWTPEVDAVTGDVTYTATFDSVKRSYTITWKNDDSSVIDTTTVAYGETPTHDDATKDATDQYTYTFAGWSPEVVAVTGDAEYTATFDSSVNEYTITWKNDDGSVIDTTTVAYGETPTHDDATKDATEQYTYTFAGWTPEVVAVTGDAEYTATFEEVKKILLGDADGDGEVTVLDATLIQRVLAHVPGTVIDEAAADVDGDGVVTVSDATFIQRFLAVMPVKYPINQYV